MPVPVVAPWAKLEFTYKAGYHPVVCHLLDVAAVTRALWRDALPERLRGRIAEALGLAPEPAARWVAFWAGAHDLGKVSPGFQAKDPAARDALRGLGFDFPLGGASPLHGAITTATLRPLLSGGGAWPALAPELANRVAIAVGGHHGTFPRAEDTALSEVEMGPAPWDAVRREMLGILAGVYGLPGEGPPAPRPDREHAVFILLAGLTSVADWIGSAQQYFPFAGPGVDLAAYAAVAEERAHRAVVELGWVRSRGDGRPATFTDLFGFAPRPLQQEAVRESETARCPGLILIEAPMGEGKTEAALFLSDTWARALGQSGTYVALPTQATSNQMFNRVQRFLATRFPSDRINLHLLHGHAALSDEYQELRLAAVYDDGDGGPGRVVAEEWFTPKKRGLLAPFAVGTIDQALLAVLQTRHQFVRLFGLATKTVILDEVHAYDAYMSVLLERLLAWLAALGCTVVLLSATLPRQRRRGLLTAFGARDIPADDVSYPRLLSVCDGRVAQRSFPATRPVEIEASRAEPERLSELLREALTEGGCAAVICNTVGRAQEVYESLRAAGLPVDLFHARFPFCQRDQIERDVLRRFGKDGERPDRSVLVATQVVEQSLDLDFDLVATEIAPIDLVLQRAGRLHRHPDRTRPARVARPRLLLLVPAENDGGVPCFGPTEFVYDRHVLLRSYLELAGRAMLRIPEDVEPLVEAVYGESGRQPPSPEWKQALRDSLAKLEARRQQDRQTALRCLIKPPDHSDDILEDFNQALDEDDPEAHRTLQALTRLAEPNVNLVCLHRSAEAAEGLCAELAGGGVIDLCRPPSLPVVKTLLRCSLTLTHPALAKHFLATQPPAAWRRTALLRHHRLAEFDGQGLMRAGAYTLRLHPKLGAVVSRDGAEGLDR